MSLQDAKLLTTPNAYKAGKLYSIKPLDGSGDFTASRATTATRVNENGITESVAINVPRIDYTNGNCPSILVEGQETNFILQSRDMTQSEWNKVNGVTVVKDSVGIDGLTNTANKLTNTGGNGNVLQSFTIADNSNTHAGSFFLKKNTSTQARFRFSVSGGDVLDYRVEVNSFNGSFNTILDANDEDVTIKEIGDWYKIKMKFTNNSSGNTTLLFQIYPDQSNTTDGYAIVDQAQLSFNQSFIGSSIFTTSSAVTRNADVLSTTVPAGVTEIVEELEDGTTNTITNIPATYNLDPNRYKYILMQ